MNKIDKIELLRKAYIQAALSPDPVTQNGALLVTDCGTIISVGCNKFPRNVSVTEERLKKPLKYNYMVHAERNVIYQCARWDGSSEDLIMVSCWAACSDCAQAIIEGGIKKLIIHQQAFDKTPARWLEDINIAFLMLEEAGVEVEIIDAIIGGCSILFDGKTWEP